MSKALPAKHLVPKDTALVTPGSVLISAIVPPPNRPALNPTLTALAAHLGRQAAREAFRVAMRQPSLGTKDHIK